jgi:hypothetical protein
MRNAMISLMILGGAVFTGSAAFADEVDIHHDAPPGVVIPLPIPQPDRHDTVDERRSHGCQTTTVHKENDRGESKTVERQNCD